MRPNVVIGGNTIKNNKNLLEIRVPTKWMEAFITEWGRSNFIDFVDALFDNDLTINHEHWNWLTDWFRLDQGEPMWNENEIDRAVGNGVGNVYYEIYKKFGAHKDWIVLWNSDMGGSIRLDSDESFKVDLDVLNVDFNDNIDNDFWLSKAHYIVDEPRLRIGNTINYLTNRVFLLLQPK